MFKHETGTVANKYVGILRRDHFNNIVFRYRKPESTRQPRALVTRRWDMIPYNKLANNIEDRFENDYNMSSS